MCHFTQHLLALLGGTEDVRAVESACIFVVVEHILKRVDLADCGDDYPKGVEISFSHIPEKYGLLKQFITLKGPACWLVVGWLQKPSIYVTCQIDEMALQIGGVGYPFSIFT